MRRLLDAACRPIVLVAAPFLISSAVTLGGPVFAQTKDAAAPADADGIAGVVSVIGFSNIKPQSGGRLSFTAKDISFGNETESAAIPFVSVQAFSIEHSTTGLMRGTKSTVASQVPYGAGQIYSAIRLGAETLTIFYRDEHRALHGAVFILPEKSKPAVLQAFAAARLRPGVGPIAGLAPERAPRAKRVKTPRRGKGAPAPAPTTQSVRVTLPVSRASDMPAAFTVGIYEDLIEKLGQNPAFETVWRQGDDRVAPSAMTLGITVTTLKKGSAAIRGAIPLIGMLAGKTLITADMLLSDAKGAPVVRQSIKGSKRLMGESMAATSSLAQRASKALEDAPELGGPRPAKTAEK